MPLRELIMEAEELGELEDTALKSFKKSWQQTGNQFQVQLLRKNQQELFLIKD